MHFLLAYELSEVPLPMNEEQLDEEEGVARRRRSVRSNPWLKRREDCGNEKKDWKMMKEEEPARFLETFRMTPTTFRHLLSLIASDISKQESIKFSIQFNSIISVQFKWG